MTRSEGALNGTKPLLEYMRQVPDPRCGRKTRHDHAELLACLTMGYLAGRTAIRRSLAWCRSRIDWLRERMPLDGGIASPSTASRMLSGIDEEIFALTFMEWAREALGGIGVHIAIDGKALRAAVSRTRGSRTPMLLNALDAATGLVLAQLPIEDKDCEITALPELLGLLDMDGSMVTIDAIGTQTGIMEQIVAQGGDFVLFVKGNQKGALEDLCAYFNDVRESVEKGGKPPEGCGCFSQSERNRDRHEYRSCWSSADCSCIGRFEGDWPFLRTVGLMRQVRIPVERDEAGRDVTPGRDEFERGGSRRRPKPSAGDGAGDDIQEVGLVSSRALTAEELAAFKRRHWSIENRLHHVLDDSFREDRSPARKSRNNLALVRKFAYNILRIAIIRQACSATMTSAMDDFSDDLALMDRYVFRGIASLA